jgi:hypothetical protein
MVIVKVLRPFNATPQGGLVDVGDEIEVTNVRAGELAMLGLAERIPSAKAAQAPQNKMSPPPENKEEPDPKPPVAVASRNKRGPRKVK